MEEGSLGYTIASIATWLAMGGILILAVWAVLYVLRLIVCRFRGKPSKDLGESLKLSLALCVGIGIGCFVAEFRAMGSWPQGGVVLVVGIVLGRVIQLNADIAKKIRPLTDRFPYTNDPRMKGWHFRGD